jgi:hypothetical protein
VREQLVGALYGFDLGLADGDGDLPDELGPCVGIERCARRLSRPQAGTKKLSAQAEQRSDPWIKTLPSNWLTFAPPSGLILLRR